MAGQIFPLITKIEHRRDGGAEAAFIADVDSLLNKANNRLSGFAEAAQRNLNTALSLKRTDGGSLDLGLDQLRAAATQQQQVAVAARELADAQLAAARATGTFDAETRQAITAAKALATAEEQAATAKWADVRATEALQRELSQTVSATSSVITSAGRGADANRALAGSHGQLRMAMVGSGQQLQDIAISLYSGQRASVVFAQQLPQLAFALSSLDGSANAVHARIGRFATFLAGPWGLAVGLAVGALGMYIASLFDSGEAAEDAEKKSRALSEVLADEKASYEEVIKAIEDYNRAQERSREITLLTLTATAEAIRKNLEEAASIREKAKAQYELYAAFSADPTFAEGNLAYAGVLSNAEAKIAEMDARIAKNTEEARAISVNIASTIGELESDPAAKIKFGFDVLRDQAGRTIKDVDALTARFTELNKAESAALEALRRNSGSRRDGAAARAAREAEQLKTFGSQAAESIQRINERFDEQPRLIDQAAQATRQLDALLQQIKDREPPGFEKLIENAEQAKQTVQDALVRPFTELREESERRVQLDTLLLQGREAEAAVLQEIWRMEAKIGELTEDQVQEIADIVVAEEQRLKVLDRLFRQQSAYLDATRSVRQEIEAMFAGTGSFKNFNNIFRDLKARDLTEQLFGDILEELDDSVKAQFGRAVDDLETHTDRASDALAGLTGAISSAASAIERGEALGGANLGGPAPVISPDGSTMVMTAMRPGDGNRPGSTVNNLTPERYFDQMTRRVVQPLVDEMSVLLGPQLAAQLGGVMQGAFYGYATGGNVGGVLGGLKGAVGEWGEKILGRDLSTTISSHLGGMLKGSQTGQMVHGIAGGFGINLSGTGSQIGGAIGSFLPIPGGDLIGALAGGILGKLFGSTKYGTATLTGADSLSVASKGKGRSEGASSLGGAVQEALANIADQLDADIGAFRTSIGTYKDSFRVSTTGRTGKLKVEYADVKDFGDDQGAAIAFAVLDAIKDGAIKGLTASQQRLLQGNSDIEQAVADVLSFQDVFTRLEKIKDPVGSALNDLDREFERLKTLFTKAGASTSEWASLEELYWLERDQVVKEAMSSSLDSMRGFLVDLTSGNSALSLRDRKATALADYNPLAARVAAGDMTAYDGFVDAARMLLDIERQMSGSQDSYFDLLKQVTNLTQGALDGGAGANFGDRSSPFGPRASDNAGVISSIADTNALLAAMNSGVDAMNRNMGRLIEINEANGSAALRTNYGYGSVSW